MWSSLVVGWLVGWIVFRCTHLQPRQQVIKCIRCVTHVCPQHVRVFRRRAGPPLPPRSPLSGAAAARLQCGEEPHRRCCSGLTGPAVREVQDLHGGGGGGMCERGPGPAWRCVCGGTCVREAQDLHRGGGGHVWERPRTCMERGGGGHVWERPRTCTEGGGGTCEERSRTCTEGGGRCEEGGRSGRSSAARSSTGRPSTGRSSTGRSSTARSSTGRSSTGRWCVWGGGEEGRWAGY